MSVFLTHRTIILRSVLFAGFFLSLQSCTVKLADDARDATPDATAVTATAATTSTSVAGSTFKLEVPIELTAAGVASTTGGTVDYTQTSTSINDSDYDGTVTAYFEIVAANAEVGVNHDVNLVTSTGTVISTITTTGDAIVRRSRSTSFTLSSGATTYLVRTPQTGIAQDVRVYSARILIQQTGATKTKIYIPLVVTANGTLHTVTNQMVDNTTSTTLTQPTATKYLIWPKDSTRFTTLASSNPWTLETIAFTTLADTTGVIQLSNITDTTDVTGAQITLNAQTPTLSSVSFSNTATNFDEGDKMGVKIAIQAGGTGSIRIQKAGLWVKLEGGLSKTESYYMSSGQKNSVGTEYVTTHRQLLDTSLFTNPIVFFRLIGYESVSGNTTVSLYNHGANDTGFAGTVAVINISPVVGTLSASTTAALNITDGDRYLTRTSELTGTLDVLGSFILIRND